MLLCAHFVLPVSGPHIEDGAVLVRDEKIVEVGKKDALMAAHPDEEVRDFGRSAILPGFVDLHTHLEYSAFRGLVDDLPYSQWKIEVSKKESALSSDDWRDAATLGALEAIQSGITTAADITETGWSGMAADQAGLRAFIYREATTMKSAEIPRVMEEVRASVDELRSTLDGDRITIGVAPHSVHTALPQLYADIAAYAIEAGLPVSTHLAGSRDEYDFVKWGSSRLATDFRYKDGWADLDWLPTGVSPVRYVLQWGLFAVPEVLGVHLIQVDDSDIEVLAEHDVAVANCPRCAAKLGMGIAPLQDFVAHGLRIGLGTDSPASNNTIDFFEEMRVGLLLQRGAKRDWTYSAEDLVRFATLGGAEALRIEDRVGSLEPGKEADIIVVDLSHSHQAPIINPYSAIVHTSNQENVVFTMVRGRVLCDTGSCSTVDMDRAMARAEEMRVKLRA